MYDHLGQIFGITEQFSTLGQSPEFESQFDYVMIYRRWQAGGRSPTSLFSPYFVVVGIISETL